MRLIVRISDDERIGALRTNSFARLRRVLIDEQTVVEIRDLGDSEALLKRSDHFRWKAQELVQQGIVPREDGWAVGLVDIRRR